MTNQYKVLAFGITRQVLGGKEAIIEVDGNTVRDVAWRTLSTRFPEFNELNSYISVNNSYSDEDQILDAHGR
ncbi:MAG: hypothetical protein QM762_01495 [Chryseolinea sp.]